MKNLALAAIVILTAGYLLFGEYIYLETTLSTQHESSIEEIAFVDSHLNDPIVFVPGMYEFYIEEENDGVMYSASVKWYFSQNDESVHFEGTVNYGDREKQISGNARYDVQGAVIRYYDIYGHKSLFAKHGDVFDYTDDGDLVIKQITGSIQSVHHETFAVVSP